MPLVNVSMVKGRSPKDRRLLSDAVHQALVEAFRVPESDYNHRLTEYDPEDFILPPGRSDKYVLVEMTVFPGRSRDAKRELCRSIVAKLGNLGVPAADVLIVLHEPPLQDWGIRGGLPADEVDLGFSVRV